MKHPPGFTLLEVLVVLAALGFLVSGIATDTAFGVRAWTVQAQLVRKDADMDAVSRTVRGLVSRMDAGSGHNPPRIVGTRSQLAFTTDLPIVADSQTGRRADGVMFVDAAHRFVLRATSHMPAASYARPAQPPLVTLVDGVEGVRLSYLSPQGPLGGWTGIWRSDFPPRLVSIHLDFPESDTRRWPDTVAAPIQERPRE